MVIVVLSTLSDTHTHIHTLVSIPLDEGSARRRGLDLYNTQQPFPSGFKPAIRGKRAKADLRLTKHGQHYRRLHETTSCVITWSTDVILSTRPSL